MTSPLVSRTQHITCGQSQAYLVISDEKGFVKKSLENIQALLCCRTTQPSQTKLERFVRGASRQKSQYPPYKMAQESICASTGQGHSGSHCDERSTCHQMCRFQPQHFLVVVLALHSSTSHAVFTHKLASVVTGATLQAHFCTTRPGGAQIILLGGPSFVFLKKGIRDFAPTTIEDLSDACMHSPDTPVTVGLSPVVQWGSHVADWPLVIGVTVQGCADICSDER